MPERKHFFSGGVPVWSIADLSTSFCEFRDQNSSSIFTFTSLSMDKRHTSPILQYMTFYTIQTKYFLKA